MLTNAVSEQMLLYTGGLISLVYDLCGDPIAAE